MLSSDSPAPSSHAFDEATTLTLATTPAAGGAARFLARTHAGYQNMVGPFGGILAAQALRAVMLHPDRLGEPVALTINYAAPVTEGELAIEARPTRTNRATQHWNVALVQRDAGGGEATVATATAVTATRRATFRRIDAVRPDAPAPSELPRSVVTGPAWLGRYDMRICAGDFPSRWDDHESDSLTRLWVRDEPARPLDFPSLAALSDVFYPRIWRGRARMTPAGTVSMTTYFHASSDELAASGAGHLLAQAKANRFVDGFFDQSGELWSEAGLLLATTTQVVYFKD